MRGMSDSGYQEFLKILEMYLGNLGISQAKQVLLNADGESSRRCRLPSRRTGEPEGCRVDMDTHSPFLLGWGLWLAIESLNSSFTAGDGRCLLINIIPFSLFLCSLWHL
jgi:hypothetical protein